MEKEPLSACACRSDAVSLETAMLLPVGDDSQSHSVPFVNVAIVAVNILVYAAVNVFSGDLTTQNAFSDYGIVPAKLAWYQFLTCMFLHGGWMHIIGNMWFLWVFGDAVENRLGHVGYAAFYLVAGIGASAFYLFFTPRTLMPCIGASGAIFGVVAAYAIIFPRNEIKMFFWFWLYVGTFHVKAVWIVGFWIVEQVFTWHLMSEVGGLGGIAYAAHVGGALFGILVAVGVRTWWPEPPMVEDWGSGGMSEGQGMWSAPVGMPVASPMPVMPSAPIDHLSGDAAPMDDVSRAFAKNDTDGALGLYREHSACRPGVPMVATAQIGVANEFFKRAEFEESLEAYRVYLSAYGREQYAPTAKFRSAIILSRRLDGYADAGKLLLEVIMEHADADVVSLAREELARIRQKT
jgi:rhomboid family protein